MRIYTTIGERQDILASLQTKYDVAIYREGATGTFVLTGADMAGLGRITVELTASELMRLMFSLPAMTVQQACGDDPIMARDWDAALRQIFVLLGAHRPPSSSDSRKGNGETA